MLSRFHLEGIWFFKNDGRQDIFSFFGSWLEAIFCSACLQSFYCIVPSLPFQVAGTMLYRVDSDIYLQTNEDC